MLTKVYDIKNAGHINFRYQPVSCLATRLIQLRKEFKKQSVYLRRLKMKISQSCEAIGVVVDDSLHSDLKATSVLPDCITMMQQYPKDSFSRIFWQQQMEAASRKNARTMRWHPLMIRWCLSLRHRSSGAYEALRDSGCLKLPSQRTLRDYTHYVEAKCGFSVEIDCMLKSASKVEVCPEREKCTILLIDEMHIREDLVYDKHSGELIGFTNLANVSNGLTQLEQSMSQNSEDGPSLAKSMLVFMMYDPLWEAVWRIEHCGLKVLGVTFDGAAVNRSLVKLHQPPCKYVPHKTLNPFSDDQRFFLFFSDAPHLMKTERNCFMSNRRSLWCKGKNIRWSHVKKFYDEDSKAGMGLRLVPKLHYEHININSFSAMRVDLAAQVLSGSVSHALHLTGGDEASETANFIGLMDKFFDTLNVHNFSHGSKALKSFQMPYTSATDFRLKWLKDDFLGYLNDWRISVHDRVGCNKTERNRMLLSAATQLGLQMTCLSFLDLVPFLFSMPDVNSFLSQRLCQDPLERFFGLQRQRGGMHENPNVVEFSKNMQALRVVKSVCKTTSRGNCRGGPHESENIEELCEPLPKRRRTSGNQRSSASCSPSSISGPSSLSMSCPSSASSTSRPSSASSTSHPSSVPSTSRPSSSSSSSMSFPSSASSTSGLSSASSPVFEKEGVWGNALYRAMRALMEHDIKFLNTPTSQATNRIATSVCRWISANVSESNEVEITILSMLKECIPKDIRTKQSFMWSCYHTLRLSPRYISEWQKFFGLIPDISVPKYWAMVFQYAGHFMLKEMIESKCTVTDAASYISPSLTYSEYNALRYAAGYVPCALRKKVIRSSYSQERKTDLLNCLDDMVDADVVPCDSTDWIECVNRGGLTFVNDLTFEIFVAMELEIHIHLQGPQQPVNLSSIAPAIKNNEDVLFLWSMLSAGWSESAGSTLLDMVISMWVGIRGFSYSSAWVEKYKKEHKRTTQKSKGLRKQL
eukprot:Em0002g642a